VSVLSSCDKRKTGPRLVAGGENVQAAAGIVTTGEGQSGAGAEIAGDDAATDSTIGMHECRHFMAVPL
jgi:hypothetical protein